MNDANDSNQVNLTKTPSLDEMYPHVSPDGTKICFVVDEGTNRRNKVRSVYYMNIDGTNRVEVARNARQPCWSSDGKKIAFLRGEFPTYNQSEYASAGLVIYDLETHQFHNHPNPNLVHMYAICWSPDGNWFLGVVKGNSQYSDAILAFEAPWYSPRVRADAASPILELPDGQYYVGLSDNPHRRRRTQPPGALRPRLVLHAG